MNPLVESLQEVDAHLDEVIGQALGERAIAAFGDDDLMAMLAVAGRLVRRAEALLVESIGQVEERSESPVREGRLTLRMGCHDVNELGQRITLLGPQTIARARKASAAVRPDWSVTHGGSPEPLLPQMRRALVDGHAGIDQVLAVATPLQDMKRRVGREDLLTADAVLAAEARGEGPDAAPPACADLLRVQALAWAAVLDPDGAEPSERRAMHRRGFTLGAARGGVIPVHGNLVPEVAAQLQRIFDAILSPATQGAGVRFREEHDEITPVDDRTRPQKQHDALATALGAAARSGELPTIGGAAPTLVVSVREHDIVSGRGWAHTDSSTESLPLSFARHTACTGVIQRIVSDKTGRVVKIGIEERVFNRHQRRAIALRDGGCIIPGCGVPAGWCEIHHVTEHALGGPTHTDNGVLLCWWHHRFLEFGGWRIRMNRGVPEVRAPGWFDSSLRWRTVTRSKTRMLDLVRRT